MNVNISKGSKIFNEKPYYTAEKISLRINTYNDYIEFISEKDTKKAT